MAVKWRLRIGTASKTLEAWGFQRCVLTRTNREASILDLGAATLDATNALMTAGDEVELVRNGASQFSGWCVSPSAGFSGTAQTVSYQAADAVFFLNRQVYRQKLLDEGTPADEGDPDADPPIPATPAIDPAPLVPTQWTSAVTLFADEAARPSTTRDQIQDIVSQTARLSGANLDGLALLDPVGQEAESITLREALDRALNYHLKALVWVEGSTLFASDDPENFSVPLTQYPDGISVVELSNLIVTGVSILYRNAFYDPDVPGPGPDQNGFFNVLDSVGATEGEGVVLLDYDLEGTADPPEGIAQQIFNEFSGTQIEATVTIVEEEVDPSAHLGKSLVITGSPWSSVITPIQRATYDIYSGTTTLEASPLPKKNLKDMIELLRLRRYNTKQRGGNGGGGGSAATEGEPIVLDVVLDDNTAGQIEIDPSVAKIVSE